MPEAWRTMDLGDVATVVAGQSPPSATVNASGDGTPFAQGSGEFGTHSPTLLAWTTSGAKLAEEGDLLMSVRAPVGALNRAPCRMAIGRGLCAIRGGEDVTTAYLAIALEYLSSELDRRSSGGMFASISTRAVRSLPIPVPPLDEQLRMVDLVGALESVAGAAARQEAAAVTAYRAVANAALSGAADWVPLGDICDVTIGRQRNPTHASGPHQTAYLRSANVKDGYLDTDDVLTMSFDPKELPTYQLAAGDVMVTEGCGSPDQLGASAIWNDDIPGVVCFQNTLLRLRATEGVTAAKFLFHLARYLQRSGGWVSIASGTNILHIGAGRAREVAVPHLSLAKQQEIADTLDALEDVRAAASDVVFHARRLRAAVVHDLLGQRHAIPVSYDRLFLVA